MDPSIFNKEMKRAKFSCTAPASTAVCSSINTKSIVHSTISACRSSFDSPRIKPLSNLIPKPFSSSTSNTPSTRKSLDHRLISASPANSSRFLLDDATYLDVYSEFEPSLTLDDIFKKPTKKPYMDVDNKINMRSKSTSNATMKYFSPRLVKPMKENQDKPTLGCRKDHELIMDTPRLIPPLKAVKTSSTSVLTSEDIDDQVVVLRVSLHCKGCEGKVRKHISKMEGVKSFNIDFKAKKVTITGNITPLGVLNSVSKVKNAQFWPSSSSPRLSTAF